MNNRIFAKSQLRLMLLTAAPIVAAAIFYFSHDLSTKAAEPRRSSEFTFDGQRAPGWWFSGSRRPVEEDIDGSQPAPDRLPTAETAVYLGKKEDLNVCFVEFFYIANDQSEPSNVLDDFVGRSAVGGSTLLPLRTMLRTMSTSEGDHTFRLHQFELTDDPGAKVMRGEEFGAFRSGTGYMDIRGYCNTPAQLKLTEPVFSAMSFAQ